MQWRIVGWGRRKRKTDDNTIRIVLKIGFTWQKFKRDGEGGREALGMRIIVSIFEMDQKWNQLDPRKPVPNLRTISQYFHYLVFRIHQFLRWVLFYIDCIS